MKDILNKKRFTYSEVINSPKYNGHHTSGIDVFKSKLPKNSLIIHVELDQINWEYIVWYKE